MPLKCFTDNYYATEEAGCSLMAFKVQVAPGPKLIFEFYFHLGLSRSRNFLVAGAFHL